MGTGNLRPVEAVKQAHKVALAVLVGTQLGSLTTERHLVTKAMRQGPHARQEADGLLVAGLVGVSHRRSDARR